MPKTKSPLASTLAAVNAAWDAYEKNPDSENESQLYKTLLKLANAEAQRRFKRPNPDAAMEGLVKLTEALKSNAYKKIEGARFSTWAQRVVGNAVTREMANDLTRQSRETPANDWLKSKILDPGIKVEQQEQHAAIQKALESLAPRQRQVVEGILAGKSQVELAAELDVSQQSIADSWRTALKKVGSDG